MTTARATSAEAATATAVPTNTRRRGPRRAADPGGGGRRRGGRPAATTIHVGAEAQRRAGVRRRSHRGDRDTLAVDDPRELRRSGDQRLERRSTVGRQGAVDEAREVAE